MCFLQLIAISCFFLISVRKDFGVMSLEEGSDSVENEGMLFYQKYCFTDDDERLSFLL